VGLEASGKFEACGAVKKLELKIQLFWRKSHEKI